MTDAPLLIERVDNVTVLTLNRPERRNAYSPQMMCMLADAWRELAGDDRTRAVVLTGAGDRAFTSGGDLELLMPLFTGAREPADTWDERIVTDKQLMNAVLLKSLDFDKPIIAAVNGAALAGGTELLQATDIRFAVPEATFGLPEPKRGLIAGGGSMVRLARQVPYARAMELLLTGDAFDAATALDMGLINQIVERDVLLETAIDYAHRIAANAPLALAAVKRTVRATQGMTLDDAFAVEAAESAAVMRSEDAREGPRAFVEKRTPNFKGR